MSLKDKIITILAVIVMFILNCLTYLVLQIIMLIPILNVYLYNKEVSENFDLIIDNIILKSKINKEENKDEILRT